MYFCCVKLYVIEIVSLFIRVFIYSCSRRLLSYLFLVLGIWDVVMGEYRLVLVF